MKTGGGGGGRGGNQPEKKKKRRYIDASQLLKFSSASPSVRSMFTL